MDLHQLCTSANLRGLQRYGPTVGRRCCGSTLIVSPYTSNRAKHELNRIYFRLVKTEPFYSKHYTFIYLITPFYDTNYLNGAQFARF